MATSQYNRTQHDLKVYNSVGRPLIEWSVKNIDDFPYNYCHQILSSKVPDIRSYIRLKLEEREQ